MPLDIVRWSSSSPTGSSSAATARTPSAIAATRAGVKVSRSRSASVSPTARSSARSAAFASRIASTRSSSSRAVAASAASLAAVGALANVRAARFAAAQLSAIDLVATAIPERVTGGAPRTPARHRTAVKSSLEQDEAVAVDDLLGCLREVLAQIGAVAARATGDIRGGVLGDALAEWLVVALADHPDRVAGLEGAAALDDADREQTRPAPPQPLGGAAI